MNRIGDRVSAVFTGVKCPGCNQYVTPTFAVSSDPGAGEEAVPGKRWSFVWREPSGKVCPKCNFPLDRYSKRVKWMRLFAAGVVLLTISLLAYLMGRFGHLPAWLSWVLRASFALGVLAFVVGLLGLVLGGRSEQAPQSTGPAK